MIYFSGVNHPVLRTIRRADVGILGTPAGGVWRAHALYPTWAADNGCFVEAKRPGAFNKAKWLHWLEGANGFACVFATLPDVMGDAVATWVRSAPLVDTVRAAGHRVAVVLQDGLESEPGIWSEILDAADVLFIGGTTEWKMGPAAAALAMEGVAASRWLHVGRVNSLKRLRYADGLGAHSADGTYLNFGNKEQRAANALRLLSWLDIINRKGPQCTAA